MPDHDESLAERIVFASQITQRPQQRDTVGSSTAADDDAHVAPAIGGHELRIASRTRDQGSGKAVNSLSPATWRSLLGGADRQ